MIQLTGHSVDRASSSQNDGSSGSRMPARSLSSSALSSLLIRRWSTVVQDKLRMAPRCQGCCRRIVGLDFDRATQKLEGLFRSSWIGRKHEWKRPHCEAVRSKVLRAFAARAFNLRATDMRQDGPHHASCDAICQLKQILDHSVVRVSPNVSVRFRVEQTNDDAHTVACLSNSSG